MPEFEGELVMRPVPEDFTERIRRRVETGLLQAGNRARADYRVRSLDRDSIAFGAEGFGTNYAIGLNEVRIHRVGRDQVRYRVHFWRWAAAAAVHGAALGLALVVLYVFFPRLRQDVAAYPAGAAWFWGMATFWCLAWPWLLTALHRGHAERALRRILGETLGAESPVGDATRRC